MYPATAVAAVIMDGDVTERRCFRGALHFMGRIMRRRDVGPNGTPYTSSHRTSITGKCLYICLLLLLLDSSRNETRNVQTIYKSTERAIDKRMSDPAMARTSHEEDTVSFTRNKHYSFEHSS